MTELKEIESTIVIKTDEDRVTPVQRLSPSAINTYFKCPRQFFYQYMCKLPTLPSIHLIKGTIVHSVLEDLFRGFKKDPVQLTEQLFIKRWEKNSKVLTELDLEPVELEQHRKDAYNMVMDYATDFAKKMQNLIDAGKVENLQHAYYMLKPKFREQRLEIELECDGEKFTMVGILDRVHEGWDNTLTIADYKTSSKYGPGLSEEYRRQLAIYAYLYSITQKKTPDFVAIVFLRYGEEFLLEVTPSLLRYARESILEVFRKTRSVEIEDYPLKESPLCRWCSFQSVCNGEKDYKDAMREARMKKLIKKGEKK